MSKKKKPKPSTNGVQELSIEGALPCKIPSGDQYEATVIFVQYKPRFRRNSVDFVFRLATPGYIGTQLPGYAAVEPNGKPGPRSKLTRWWLLIADFEMLARRDRIALSRFREYLFRVQVGPRLKDWQHRQVSELEQHSQVQEILEIITRVKKIK